MTMKNVEKHIKKTSKFETILKNVLLSEYHEFFDVFDKKISNVLTFHRLYDHKIVLKKDVISKYISLYNMSEAEL
jgi:hypothetical protein